MGSFAEVGFVGDYAVDVSIKGRQRVRCPECSDKRTPANRKIQCVSVDVDKGVWYCHHCHYSGNIHHKTNRYAPKEIEVEIHKLTADVYKWLRTRGISKETADSLPISMAQSYFKKIEKTVKCISFISYYEGIATNIKYRLDSWMLDSLSDRVTLDKKIFSQHPGGEMILWNYNAIKDEEWCVITEGEMDTMSYVEIGVSQSCSVPNGAPTPNGKNNDKMPQLIYIDRCYAGLKNKRKIYISVDNDEAGKRLQMELVRRLGKDRCFIVSYPDGCKDANDVLVKHGANRLLECLENAEPPKVEGVIYPEELWSEIYNVFNNGIVNGANTGWRQLDEHITFYPSHFTVVTGIFQHGKSSFLDHMLLRISKRNYWKWAIYSIEQDEWVHLIRLAEILIGKPFLPYYNNRMSESEMKKAFAFIKEHVYYIHPNGNFTLDKILGSVEGLVRKHGVNGFILDPWNSLEHLQGSDNETLYTAKALNKIRQFSRETMVHSIVVPHPRKMNKVPDGTYAVPDGYDVSGSANWGNVPDNFMTVYRAKENTQVHFFKIKNKYIGKRGVVYFNYDINNQRFYEANTDSCGDEFGLQESPPGIPSRNMNVRNYDDDPGF